MKRKEGRDYLQLNDCIAETDGETVSFLDIATCFTMSMQEWKRVVEFVSKKQAAMQKGGAA